MLRGFIGFLIALMVLVPTSVSLAGTFIENFDGGDDKGWERSPQNKSSTQKGLVGNKRFPR